VRATGRRTTVRGTVRVLREPLGEASPHRPADHEQPPLFALPAPPLRVVPPGAPEAESGEGRQLLSSALADLSDICASVLEFHLAFDLPREPLPTIQISDVLAQLRVRLLREEVDEFIDATARRDIVAIADALADVVYVAYGSAITYGIDLDAVLREVHRANMSKLDEHGRPIHREDGKVMKSQRYRPPDVVSVLEQQLELFSLEETSHRSSGVC
jgi:predicted HAD superfamily Cof-like phosphohydrolase